jgi:hypothetical protein
MSSSFTPSANPSDLFPSDNSFYKDVSALPAYSGSATLMSGVIFGHSDNIHIDFGIRMMQVNSGTNVGTGSASPDYLADSDAASFPFPIGGTIETGDWSSATVGSKISYNCQNLGGGDCHMLIADVRAGHRKLYETWSTSNSSDAGTGTWSIVDETVWLMDHHYDPVLGRGLTCTSADAAGLSVAAGLIGVRETLVDKEIKHAIRFILSNSQIRRAFVPPATHGTTAATKNHGIPYGTRLRLRANFPVASLPNEASRTIAIALQKYGMILADGGSDAFTAESDVLYKSQGLSWAGKLGYADLSTDANANNPGVIRFKDFEVVDFDTAHYLDFSNGTVVVNGQTKSIDDCSPGDRVPDTIVK